MRILDPEDNWSVAGVFIASALLSLALLGASAWVVVKVLQWMGVL